MAAFDAIAEAYIRLRPKVSDDFESEGKSQIGGAMGRIAEDAALVFASKKIFDFGKQGLDELKDAEAVAAQTASAIKATGGAAGVSADQIADLAGSLSDLSGKDDELIQKGENLFLTFKGVRNEVGEGNQVFDRATAAALDLSVSGFGSMESASVMLGKALNDPVAGLTALSRAGVTFTDAQKQTIQSLVDSGNVLEAQKVILAEVEHQVGGAAKAYGETLPGKLERAQTAMDNAKGAAVSGLAPALELLASVATKGAEAFQSLPPPLQEVLGLVTLVGGGVGSLIRPTADFIGLLERLRSARAASAAADEGASLVKSLTNLAGTSGLAQKATSGLGAEGISMASKLGIAAVAVVGLAVAYEGLTHSTSVSIDAQKAMRASTDDLVDGFRKFNALGAGDQFIKRLTESGDAGVGTLKRLRDAMAGSGQDTSKLDAALAGAKTSQDNLTASTTEGQKVLGDTLGTDRAKAAADSLKESLDRQKTVLDGIKSGYDAAVSAQNSLVDAQLGATGADIARRDAIDKQGEAYQKLAEAQAGGDPKAIEQAKRDLERADLDVERAVAAQAKAQAEAAETTDKASGKQHDAAQTARDYYDNLRGLSQTGIPEVDTALQGLIGQLEGASKGYQGRLQYQLDINGYVLNPTEIQALLDQGLGISAQSLEKQAQKDRGDFATAGPHADGGFVPAGMPFGHGEEGWEIAFLGQGVSRLNKDAFILNHQTSAALAGQSGPREVHHHTWNIYETTSPQRTAAETVNALRSERFLTATG